jgi:ABC-type Fe3+ transport system permease subunit
MGGVALPAALLIAVLVFGDAAIPSAMGTRASASEALAAVSLGAAPLDAVARGLPGIVAAVALAMLVLPLAGGAVPVFTSAPASARVTAWRRALAILLTAVAVAPPLAAGLGSLSSDSLALPDVAGPLATSVAGALPVAIGAVALGSLLSGLGPRPLATLAVVALAVPPPLAASLALGVLTLAAPQLRESTAAFTLVSTLRLAPLAALVIATVAARRPPSWFEAARLAGLPRWRTLAGISVPSLAGPALAAAAVAFLLSFHDVVLALMLDPPGHDRLGPAVFSRLGVGSPSTTALLALTPAAAVALATGAALAARRGRRA